MDMINPLSKTIRTWELPSQVGKIGTACADLRTMKVDLSDLKAFLVVARAKGFREGARVSGSSASGLSVAVSRLEEQLGVRLLHRTTRSLVLTVPVTAYLSGLARR